jgi:hypothetical protein
MVGSCVVRREPSSYEQWKITYSNTSISKTSPGCAPGTKKGPDRWWSLRSQQAAWLGHKPGVDGPRSLSVLTSHDPSPRCRPHSHRSSPALPSSRDIPPETPDLTERPQRTYSLSFSFRRIPAFLVSFHRRTAHVHVVVVLTGCLGATECGCSSVCSPADAGLRARASERSPELT